MFENSTTGIAIISNEVFSYHFSGKDNDKIHGKQTKERTDIKFSTRYLIAKGEK